MSEWHKNNYWSGTQCLIMRFDENDQVKFKVTVHIQISHKCGQNFLQSTSEEFIWKYSVKLQLKVLVVSTDVVDVVSTTAENKMIHHPWNKTSIYVQRSTKMKIRQSLFFLKINYN